MWAPAESLFAAELTSSSLTDIVFTTDSACCISGAFQLRPQAEALSVHTRIVAAILSRCCKHCISLETFYEKLA
jgi:hypothetical protein